MHYFYHLRTIRSILFLKPSMTDPLSTVFITEGSFLFSFLLLGGRLNSTFHSQKNYPYLSIAKEEKDQLFLTAENEIKDI